jgi:hypothetical protein
VERLRFQQRADVTHRVPQFLERLAVEERTALALVEPQHQSHRGGLAGAVRPEKSGDATRPDDEVESVDGAG